MRQTSPHITALIEKLMTPASYLEKLKGSRDDAAILAQIGESGEVAAIIDILPLVLAGKPDVATAAANAIQNLLRGISTTELIQLDWTSRHRAYYSGDYYYDWHKLSPDRLGLFQRFGGASVSVLELASFHQNGYVREEAIKKLDRITGGTELPFLILRLNDWVSNVRDAAYEAIRSRITPEYGRHFIFNLILISRLKRLSGRITKHSYKRSMNFF